MKLLKEIMRSERARQRLLRHGGNVPAERTIIRQAVRGIVPRGRELLMVFSSVIGEYKFPGGGVDGNETDEQTLVREVLEECGARVVRVDGPFGKVVEYDIPGETEFDLFQMTSRYYMCQVEPDLCEQSLDPYERDLGFHPAWVDIDAALNTNNALLNSVGRKIPRWTRRDTFVLNLVREQLFGKP